jgi:uncharacterized membrane protein
VEGNGFMAFEVSLLDIDGGAIAADNIDITAISAVLKKSTGGSDFSSVGITQPTFAKAAGRVYCSYQFAAAEWAVGDIYQLTLGGITVTITGETAYVASKVWANVVNEAANIDTNVETILSELAGAAGISSFPGATDITDGVSLAEAIRAILTSLVGGDDYDAYTNISNSANASLNAIFQKFAVLFAADGANIFNPTIQGSARTDLELALAAFATYFVASGAAMNTQVNNNTARTNLEQVLQDYLAVIGCDGTNIFNPSIGGSTRTTVEAAFAALGTIIGNPATDTLTSIAAKLGNLARDIDTILGARWDASGDLGTDVAAIFADIGDASASALGSILAILGNPATALATRIGNPDAHTLVSLTAKLGDLARDLDTILGARWDSSGDLGTDIGTILTNLTTIAGYMDTEIATIITELGKVPKSDSNVTFNSTALGDINAQVDTALNTQVPASPQAGSLNDVLSKAAGGNTFDKATDSAEALSDKLGGYSGDGGAAADDSVKAELDLVKTQTDKIDEESYTNYRYAPGLKDTTDLEAATKTITATAEASGVGNADYSSALTLTAPSNAKIAVARIGARLSVTIDSDDGTHDLKCRVYVAAQDADHMLFDLTYSSTGNQLSVQDTLVGTKEVIFNLLKDGASHTFYFFFWSPGNHSPVISVVELWEAVGTVGTDWEDNIITFNHDGFASYHAALRVQGTGAPRIDLCPNGLGSGDYIFTASGATAESFLANALLKGLNTFYVKGSVATDLSYIYSVSVTYRSLA